MTTKLQQTIKRQEAIRRCLEQGEAAAPVAADLGVAASTLQGWLRWARLERELVALRQERDGQTQRQEQLVAELRQAALALAELKQLVEQEVGRAAG